MLRVPTMADLLECLVQIRALHETAPRLAALLAAASAEAWRRRPEPDVWAPIEVLAHLADAELFFGTRLRLILTSERPRLEAYEQARLAERAGYLSWSPGRALERFTRRREDTLDLLDGCSADDLDRIGVHASRGPMSVADLIATMLAHDTDHVAQMRLRLGLAGP
jgi:uncharacterized damage-inducible protein DinB